MGLPTKSRKDISASKKKTKEIKPKLQGPPTEVPPSNCVLKLQSLKAKIFPTLKTSEEYEISETEEVNNPNKGQAISANSHLFKILLGPFLLCNHLFVSQVLYYELSLNFFFNPNFLNGSF